MEFEVYDGSDVESQHENENNITEEDVKRNYSTPGHPTAFSNIKTVFNFYKGHFSYQRLSEILKSVESYTLHKEFHKQPRNISYARFKRYQFQMDLCEVQNLAQYNDGVRYLFNVVDCFTRYAFVRALVDKKTGTVLSAFQNILEEAVEKPTMIVCDKGMEFNNNEFTQFCQRNGIKLVLPHTSTHAAYVERFNRTFQRLVYSYMTQRETNRYIDALQDLVHTYNNRQHRMIGMTPNQAENTNSNLKINNLISKRENKLKPSKPSLKIGEYVRIAQQKSKFSRGYNWQTNPEIFIIDSIDTRKKIPLYHLRTYNGREQIVGGFYRNELTPTNIQVFRIERILGRRRINGVLHVLVKWVGYDDTYNEWIPQDTVQDIE